LDKTCLRLNEEADAFLKESVFENSLRQIAKAPRGFYGWPNVRYLLYEYEQELRKASKTERTKILWNEFIDPPADHVTVEHIYPQKADDQYWKERFGKLTQRKRQVLLGSLGNLLALSKPKNSSLQNKPFPEKSGVQPGTLISYRYGSMSENQVAELSDWTPDAVIRRTLDLLGFMERRWGIQLGDTKKKLWIANLDTF
jgi:hypothetical protein